MESETQPTRQRIVTAIHNWDRHAKRSAGLLSTCSQQKLTSAHIHADLHNEGLPASLAEAAMERRMGASLDEVLLCVEAMESACVSLQRLAAGAKPYAEDEPYFATEERSIRERAGDVSEMYARHLEQATTIANDVLWCEDRDTHAIYGSVLLLQPAVNKDEVAMLKDVCELAGDLATSARDEAKESRAEAIASYMR